MKLVCQWKGAVDVMFQDIYIPKMLDDISENNNYPQLIC